jgi:peroxiredoxin
MKTLLAASALLSLLIPLAPATTGQAEDRPSAQSPDADVAQASERTWSAELGKLAPDFELTAASGESWSLSEHRGKLVVLEWFNPSCPVVQKAHAPGGALAQLGNDAREKGVVWVAINSGAPRAEGSGAEANLEGAERMGLNYPILLDETGWVGRMYGATNTPHLFVIDKAGVLAYRGGHEDKQGAFLVERALLELGSGGEVSKPSSIPNGCVIQYPTKVEFGRVAPDFTLTDFSGVEHTLSAQRGANVVLEWFNPGCPVVKKAHGDGGSLQSAARREAALGTKWFAINSGAPGKQGTTAASNLEAKKRWGIAHPILADPEGTVGRAYAATTTPQMVVLDQRGVVVYTGAHEGSGGELLYVEQALAELRAGKAVSVPQTRSFGCGVKYGK